MFAVSNSMNPFAASGVSTGGQAPQPTEQQQEDPNSSAFADLGLPGQFGSVSKPSFSGVQQTSTNPGGLNGFGASTQV